VIGWIQGPWKLLLAVAILAVSVKWLVLPGIVIAAHSGTIDSDQAAMRARMKPIDGTVTRVAGKLSDSSVRRTYSNSVEFEARPADRATALHGASLVASVRLKANQDEPPGLAKAGDTIKLWYDPETGYLSDSEPGAYVPALWIGLVLLGLGLVGAAIAAILVKLSIRRPTRAPG
jgi:hypothetical protein